MFCVLIKSFDFWTFLCCLDKDEKGVLGGQLASNHNDPSLAPNSTAELICGEVGRLNSSIKSSLDGKPNVFDA